MITEISAALGVLILLVIGNLACGFLPTWIIARIQFLRWPDNRWRVSTFKTSLLGIVISLLLGAFWTFDLDWFYGINASWKVLVFFYCTTGGCLVAHMCYSQDYQLED